MKQPYKDTAGNQQVPVGKQVIHNQPIVSTKPAMVLLQQPLHTCLNLIAKPPINPGLMIREVNSIRMKRKKHHPIHMKMLSYNAITLRLYSVYRENKDE